ncbi:MAG: type VI secretion system protein TssA [Nitrospiria bacterium]
MLDLKSLLEPVSEEVPSGPDLEYDAAYSALESATQGKPEQELGQTKVAAEPPKWDEVKRAAIDLFDRTKDLRVATWLLSALVHTEGLSGLEDGLRLLRELLSRYWVSLHPQLDPGENNDPTERINIVLMLVDPQSTLLTVRRAPLVNSKVFGRFSLKDILIASGVEPMLDKIGVPQPETATVDAAFTDTPIEALQKTADIVSNCIAHVGAIETFFTEQVGSVYAPSFKNLVNLLKEIAKVLSDQLGRHGVNKTDPIAKTQSEAATIPSTQLTAHTLPAQITSREDVFRQLDKIIAYYTKYEPSSPVPLLLKRAKQLIHKDFMEIINDLVPAGVAQAKTICGPQDKK